MFTNVKHSGVLLLHVRPLPVPVPVVVASPYQEIIALVALLLLKRS